MRIAALLLIGLSVNSCMGPLPGSFCSSYLPLGLSRSGAEALFDADADAARRAAVNEDTYRECG